MIFSFICFLICIIGLLNYKKGFFLYLIFKTILVPNINVLSIPGLPMITMDLFLSIYFFVLFIIKGQKYKAAKLPFPYKLPFGLLLISWFCSCIFAVAGFGAEITRMITMTMSELIIIYMIWELVETKQDFKWLFKWITMVFFITCIYGIIDYVIKGNPIVNYETSLVKDVSKVVNWNSYGDTVRGYRVQSFFNHAIGAGLNWTLYITWLFSVIVSYKWKIPNKAFSILTAVLCFPCMLLTNSRAPIVFFAVCCLEFIGVRKKKTLRIIIVGIVAVVAFSPILANYAYNFMSIFSSKVQQDIGGSTVTMRFEQLGACLRVLQMSPVFGMGTKFLDYMDIGLILTLRGLESIWFIAMTEYGIVGVIAYAIRAIFEIIIVPKYFKSRDARIVALAYWVTNTLTSMPGFLTYIYYIVIFFYIKQTKVYESGFTKAYNNIFGKHIRLRSRSYSNNNVKQLYGVKSI